MHLVAGTGNDWIDMFIGTAWLDARLDEDVDAIYEGAILRSVCATDFQISRTNKLMLLQTFFWNYPEEVNHPKAKLAVCPISKYITFHQALIDHMECKRKNIPWRLTSTAEL